MNPFPKFMASLVGWGPLGLGGWAGVVMAVIGIVPLAAGLLDVCVFAPLFGNPLSGQKTRAGK